MVAQATRVKSTANGGQLENVWRFFVAAFLLPISLVVCASEGLAQQSGGQTDYAAEWEESEEMERDPIAGPYARLGVAIGFPSPSNSLWKGTAGGGLSMVGGYRFNSWLAANGDFTFTAGSSLERLGIAFYDATYMAMTVNGKVYPLGFFDSGLSQWVDPYVVMGLGVGAYSFSPVRYWWLSTSNSQRSAGGFLFRAGGGLDVPVWNQIGAYFEGAYDVMSGDDFSGAGRIVIGASYRF